MSKPQNPTPLWLEKSSASLYWVLAACLVAEEIHILAAARLRIARNDKVAGEGVVLRSWAPLDSRGRMSPPQQGRSQRPRTGVSAPHEHATHTRHTNKPHKQSHTRKATQASS